MELSGPLPRQLGAQEGTVAATTQHLVVEVPKLRGMC